MFRTPAIAAAALVAAALTSAPAAAASHSWQVGDHSFNIYYSDLDMNSTAGRAALLVRVTRAADRLCRDAADRRACTADVLRSAAPAGRAALLKQAMIERDAVRLAAR